MSFFIISHFQFYTNVCKVGFIKEDNALFTLKNIKKKIDSRKDAKMQSEDDLSKKTYFFRICVV